MFIKRNMEFVNIADGIQLLLAFLTIMFHIDLLR